MDTETTPEVPGEIVPASIDLRPAVEAAVALGREGVETLERLEAMQARQDERSARRAFNKAIATLHRRVGSITKNRTANFKTKAGTSVSYRYADLHQIATTLRAHTGPLGLSWRWNTEYGENAETVTCTVAHEAGHSEASTWRAPIEGGNPMTSNAQKAKIATTFAQRVTLIQAFGLTDCDDDVDGMEPDTRGPTITDEQERELEALGESAAVNWDRVYQTYGITALAGLPAAKFGELLGLFTRQAKAKARKA